MIKGYSTSISGVELYAWKGIAPELIARNTYEYHFAEELGEKIGRYPFYMFLHITVESGKIIQEGIHSEGMKIKYAAYLANRDEILEKEREIKELDEKLWREVEEMQGLRRPEEEKYPEEKEKPWLDRMVENFWSGFKKWLKDVMGVKGPYHIPPGDDKIMKDLIRKEVDMLYERMKETFGGISPR